MGTAFSLWHFHHGQNVRVWGWAQRLRSFLRIRDTHLRYMEGEEHACLFLTVCIVLSALNSIIGTMVRAAIEKASHELDFTTVRDATCFSKNDAKAIWEAIGDDVEEI